MTLVLLSPILELSAETKIHGRMYFSVGREGFTMAQLSQEGIFAASDLATRSSDDGTRARNSTSY